MCNSLQLRFHEGPVFCYTFYYSKKFVATKLSKLCNFACLIQAVHTHQLLTNFTDGVLSNLSGRRSISFKMFANLTGSSCRKNAKEVLSHPLVEPMNKSKPQFLFKEVSRHKYRLLTFHKLQDSSSLQSLGFYWPAHLSVRCLCRTLFT